jgi:DNA polymerase elongation subunit (family B)
VCQDISDYFNFYQNTMGAKREAIAQSGIWVGKKRYALHVWDMEGVRYDHPKVKVTGIETQKSSTPEVVRNALLDALEILLGGTEQQLRDFVIEFEQKFKQFPLEAISFPRSVNNVEKYSGTDGNPIKGCPGHVKAAIAHNIALQKLNLLDVQPITSGDKILYCYMKPNPFHTPAMAYVERPPKEFNLQNYIDYDTQFEKAFMGPLTSLMDAVKWGLVDKSSLDDFF